MPRTRLVVYGPFLLTLLFGCGDSAPSATAVVGPTGGEVEVSGAKVVVPAGALEQDVELGVKEAALGDLADLPAQSAAASRAFAFTPHGTVFQLPVTITLPFSAAVPGVRVLRLDDEQDTSWEAVDESTVAGGVVSFEATHFSVYVVTEPTAACANECGADSDGLSCEGCGAGAVCTAAGGTGGGSGGGSGDSFDISCRCEAESGLWNCGESSEPDAGAGDGGACANECGPASAGLSCEGCGAGATCAGADSETGSWMCSCGEVSGQWAC